MDFPEINLISDFEAGVKCLQNPSLVPRFFSLEKIPIPIAYNFWKWGALILAILATFSSLIRKIKLLFIYIRKIKPSAEPILQYLGEDYDISDDEYGDDQDDKCSSSASEEPDADDDLEDYLVAGSSYYFREKGQNGTLRHRQRKNSLEKFPWTEFCVHGKNVVKLWDSFSLGLDYEYEDLSKSVVTLWDMNQEVRIGNLFSASCEVPAVAMSSPSVVVSSEVENDNGGIFAAFDTRMKGRSSVISANWGNGKVVGVNHSGDGKVYVRDDGAGVLTVGDMRNVKSPLELTEIDTWWDADAVIVEEKFDGSS